jgi:hypothetical protein
VKKGEESGREVKSEGKKRDRKGKREEYMSKVKRRDEKKMKRKYKIRGEKGKRPT